MRRRDERSRRLTTPRLDVVALCLALCALGACLALGYANESNRRQLAGISSVLAKLPVPAFNREHDETRFAIIRSQLARTAAPIVVFGDSIVESALLPAKICGHPLINGGVGGAGVGYLVRYAPLMVGESKPQLLVFAVGINDAVKGAAAGAGERVKTFIGAYRAVLQELPSGIPVIVSTIPPVRDGVTGYFFDNGLVDEFNAALAGLGRPVIDLHAVMAPENLTTDGIHLNAEGYTRWNGALVSAIESACPKG